MSIRANGSGDYIMTRKFYSAALAGAALLAVSMGATSANAASATATATAKIVTPITITQDTQLNFGTIVPSASASTVDISVGGARTCGAGLTCSGSPAAGAFHATGSANEAVTLSLTGTTTTLNGPSSSTMSVSGLALSISTGSFDGTGNINFTTGGTLAVGANQTAGVYNGNYTVNVNYQ